MVTQLFERILLSGFTLLFLQPTGFTQPDGPSWQQVTNYSINVEMDDTQHTLDGFLELEYINLSPDTLQYIWFHFWPNAYKNDKTAFSQQYLLTGKTDFYFSRPEQKGYMNRIDFKVNGQRAELQDHPQYIDAGKLVLPAPLPPGATAHISTPFHVQLPYRFSRMGHADSFYAVTQWFPKAAVYDRDGWHPMPYLELGEYYADLGTYTVTITLPENYIVAATGELQTQAEKLWMLNKANMPITTADKKITVKKNPPNKPIEKNRPAIFGKKTIEFVAEKVVDFAWFAYPNWQIKHETLQLNRGSIDVWNFVMPDDVAGWENSMAFTRNAIVHYSTEVGEYPYPQVSVVGDPHEQGSGMEYPMVTVLNTVRNDQDILEQLILHEVGHNWFQAILANNERQHPWLDEGLNSFIEKKWTEKVQAFHKSNMQAAGKKYRAPLDQGEWLLAQITGKRLDQPIRTPAGDMVPVNYYTIPYTKTAQWLETIEEKIGKEKMREAMQAYYQRSAFRHVQPMDLKNILEERSGRSMDAFFAQLDSTGPITDTKNRFPVWPVHVLTSLAPTKNRKLGITPSAGFNEYDKMQLGVLLHNYSTPIKPFQWVATPMFATGSRQLTGYGRAGYTWYPTQGKWHHFEVFTSAARFNTNMGRDAGNQKLFAGFTKYMPGLYAERKRKYPLSTSTHWLELKSWVINERTLSATTPPAPGDTVFVSIKGPSNTIVIPQISMGWKNDRSLYPYEIKGTLQQVKDILRLTADARYFFNYDASGKGIRIRAFAGKIFYMKERTDEVRIANSRYHFSMHGPNGNSDYTYSAPFMDRNQSVHLAGRQIMERDAFFKYRSDFSSVRPGLNNQGLDFFDNWMAALNFEFDIPDKINPLSVLPIKVPLKVFADVGTSASPWTPEAEHEKFLYSIGLHVPVLKIIQVYIPLIDSKAFDEPNRTNDPNRADGPTWWQKKLTFALDLQPLKPKLLNVPLIR